MALWELQSRCDFDEKSGIISTFLNAFTLEQVEQGGSDKWLQFAW